MQQPKNKKRLSEASIKAAGYDDVLAGVVGVLEAARAAAARSVNTVMTSTYWEIGRRIVEQEQAGADRAEYGVQLIKRLASDLTNRFGRGFGQVNLSQMRRFYLTWPPAEIVQTVSEKTRPGRLGRPERASAESILQTASEQLDSSKLSARFPLPWSHYVLLLKVEQPEARRFYEVEALRGGWSVRQLDRQIATLFYERTLASRNKAAMLGKAAAANRDGPVPEQELKNPLLLEFLGLKDEYSETELEEALIQQLESFLLELGGDFTFVGRQKRLRIDDEWYRVDLVFFHRTLRCLVIIDLKVGKFTHADAGQMLLYLGYAAEHWTRPGENPPVGLILCSQHNQAVAHYTLDRLPDKVLASEYRMILPDEKTLAAELTRTQAALESRTRKELPARKTKRKPGARE